MQNLRAILLAVLVLFALPVSLPAKDRLIIGIDRSAAPMEFERDGKPAGFNVDIMRAIADLGGYQPEFRFLDWTNVLESVRNRTIDIMFAMRTSDREKIYLFGTPFLEISVRIFVREDVFGISGLPDLENRTVAVVRGFACQDALIESGLDFRIVPVETVAQALDLLANGDVFAFVGQYHLAKYALQQKARQVKTIGDPLQTTPFGIAMHREQQNGISRLDRALEELKKTGEYAKIHEKWYGTSSGPDTQTVLRYSLPILIGLLAIFGILVTWSLTLRHQVRVRTSALYENLEKFRKLTDRAPFPVAIIHDNSIEYINPQFTMTFGYTLDDIPDCEAWFSTVFPDPAYRATVIADWQQHVTEKIQINDTPRTYDVTTRDGRIVTVDFRMIHLDDGRIIIILEDATLKHRMEEERLRQQQIESISLLAGGIAHDFNNILMHLIGHINLLQISEGMAEEQMESLSSMERSIQRARGITGQLLTFSRGGAPVKKLQSLAPIIRESIDFVFHGSNCTAEVAVPDNLPALDIDSGQISQTLNNILINAIQAMPDGGIIQICAVCLNREQVVPVKTENNARQWVAISIRDHGPGIPPNLENRIFTPYFTSKQHGTGLGLTTAWSIVQRHGGELRFSSTRGQGTTFTIFLPVPADRNIPADNHETQAGFTRFKGRVIIMDDEQQIINVLSRMLERLGLQVTVTKNGSELVREYMQAHDAGRPYDIVITDLTVPGGMGGREAISILRNAVPSIKAIVSSGFSCDPVLADCTAWGFVAALVKPYTFSQLEQILASVLNQPS